MEKNAEGETVGYVSNFLEIFAWIMTLSAYEALWQLLCPSINPYGWGYDLWYDNYARVRVPGHRMGVISNVSVYHIQSNDNQYLGNNKGRTDTANVSTKWDAVLAQEKYYRSLLDIPLRRYRKTMKLQNNTWSGVVTDFLYNPRS
jgi:hypothetical protein